RPVSLDVINQLQDGLFSLAQDRDVEAMLQGFVGADRGMRAAADQEGEAASKAIDQAIGVPDPAGEQAEADDVGFKGLGLGDDCLEVMGGVEGTARGAHYV